MAKKTTKKNKEVERFPITRPEFEGAIIEEVVEEREDAFLCDMSDGTSKWVSKELF